MTVGVGWVVSGTHKFNVWSFEHPSFLPFCMNSSHLTMYSFDANSLWNSFCMKRPWSWYSENTFFFVFAFRFSFSFFVFFLFWVPYQSIATFIEAFTLQLFFSSFVSQVNATTTLSYTTWQKLHLTFFRFSVLCGGTLQHHLHAEIQLKRTLVARLIANVSLVYHKSQIVNFPTSPGIC